MSPGKEFKPRVGLKRSGFKRTPSKRSQGWVKCREAKLLESPFCEIGALRNLSPHKACDVHHSRGRAGKLITDDRFLMSSCRECHEWAHAHPAEAREAGALASASEWNVSPR